MFVFDKVIVANKTRLAIQFEIYSKLPGFSRKRPPKTVSSPERLLKRIARDKRLLSAASERRSSAETAEEEEASPQSVNLAQGP